MYDDLGLCIFLEMRPNKAKYWPREKLLTAYIPLYFSRRPESPGI